MQAPSGGVQIPQLSLQQTCPTGQIVRPQGTPPDPGWQYCSVQEPPSGAQMPQLSLQQNSSGPQVLAPHGSPDGAPQNSRVHPSPNGTHRLQLSLQQYSPGPQIASLHCTCAQRSSEHGVSTGTQIPPQFGQHVVPSIQSMAAHGL
jgi:hypothetical protein